MGAAPPHTPSPGGSLPRPAGASRAASSEPSVSRRGSAEIGRTARPARALTPAGPAARVFAAVSARWAVVSPANAAIASAGSTLATARMAPGRAQRTGGRQQPRRPDIEPAVERVQRAHEPGRVTRGVLEPGDADVGQPGELVDVDARCRHQREVVGHHRDARRRRRRRPRGSSRPGRRCRAATARARRRPRRRRPRPSAAPPGGPMARPFRRRSGRSRGSPGARPSSSATRSAASSVAASPVDPARTTPTMPAPTSSAASAAVASRSTSPSSSNRVTRATPDPGEQRCPHGPTLRRDHVYDGRVVIVDGNNVVGASGGQWWRDRPAAVRRLLGRLSCYADARAAGRAGARRRPRTTCPEGAHGGVVVRYATRRGRDAADDRIRERLDRARVPAVDATSRS